MNTFVVEKRDWGSMLSGQHTTWAVINRKTGSTHGEHQQFAIANAVAAHLNKLGV